MSDKRVLWLRWSNAIGFLCMVGVNAVANLLPLGGVKTEDISRRYFNLFTPAPVTFAIWGAIYLLLAGFTLYQAGAFHKRLPGSEKLVERIGAWFLLSCLFNSAWLFCWHYDLIGLSTAMMLALLYALAMLTRPGWGPEATPLRRLLGQAPFSLYFGWITVATIANVTVWLTKLRWDGWGVAPETWMIVMLILGALIAGATALRRRDWVYAVAVLWAYLGILIRQFSAKALDGAYPGVIVTDILCCLGLMAAGVRAALSKNNSRI